MRRVGCLDRAAGLTQGEGLEEDAVTGGDLAHLPQLGGCDGAGADKAAQAGAVKHQRDRHVACMRTRTSGLPAAPRRVPPQASRCGATERAAAPAARGQARAPAACPLHAHLLLALCSLPAQARLIEPVTVLNSPVRKGTSCG